MNGKMKLASLTVSIAAVLGTVSTHAATITLPLGTIHTGDDILNYFDGGTDSTGEGPGQNLGFGFSANATAQKAGTSAATGDGRFENNPSGQTEILAFSFSNATASYVNYAAGFSSLSFNYSYSNNNPGGTDVTAYLYSGMNGSGTLLEALTLTPAGTAVGCKTAGDSYCSWSAASTGAASFGTAESVLFATSPTATTTATPVNLTEIDGLTVTPVPLPASLGLALGGLFGLAGFARRRRV
jgi:hypothetical protein